MNQYEAMFIIDPTFGATFETCEQEVKRLMERAEAELLFCRKWDDRRLAYKIKGRKRGVYVLTFSGAPRTSSSGWSGMCIFPSTFCASSCCERIT